MFKKTEMGKILLIVGILFLIDPILQTLKFYYWYGLLVTLFFGWLLTILGASLISFRVSAWTFFLMGFYLYFIFFKGILETDMARFLGFYALLIPSLHILVGLILGVGSFIKSKKR